VIQHTFLLDIVRLCLSIKWNDLGRLCHHTVNCDKWICVSWWCCGGYIVGVVLTWCVAGPSIRGKSGPYIAKVGRNGNGSEWQVTIEQKKTNWPISAAKIVTPDQALDSMRIPNLLDQLQAFQGESYLMSLDLWDPTLQSSKTFVTLLLFQTTIDSSTTVSHCF